MNFYKLVFIKGISRFDTWRFNSKEDQYTYFNNLIGEKLDYTYPPHYTNTLRFDIEDVDYSTDKYNYCLLYFNQKYYCYFIDSIEYINENVFELRITLDTIQTFMFDIDFTYATVNRQSIKRWDDINNMYINRHYQRENLSREDFINTQYNSYSYVGNFILVKSSSIEFYGNNEPFLTLTQINDTFVQSGFYYFLIPLVKYPNPNVANIYTNHLTLYKDGDPTSIGTINLLNTDIDNLIKAPNVQQIYLINELFLESYLRRVVTRTDITDVGGYKTLEQYCDINIDTNATILKEKLPLGNSSYMDALYICDINTIFNSISSHLFPFEVNRKTNKLFDKKYIPQLIDENYYHLFFGEKTNYTTYPLSKSDKIQYNLKYQYDLLSGERIYKVMPDGEANDRYNTTINVTSLETLELVNDPWKEYEARNKATLTTGRALSTFSSFFEPATRAKVQEVNNPNYDAVMAQAFGVSPTMTTLKTNPIGMAINTGMSVFSNQMNYVVTKENLEYSPNTVKQGNNVTSDLINRSIDVVKSVETVKDIDNVAKLLEQFGYAVDFTYTNTNIFDINYRYYFNILRCENVQIEAKNCIITELYKGDIISRLKNGLRLWNKENNNEMYDNLIYDNVENDFIETEE